MPRSLFRPPIALLLLLLPLAACGLFDDDEERLSGERLAVRQSMPEGGAGQVTARALPPAETAGTWTQAGRTAAHQGGHLAGPGGLDLAWRVSAGTGGGDGSAITAAPVVAGGRVFALDAAARLGAFDADSGAEIWSTTLTPEGEDDGEEGFGGGLAVAGTRIYAATGFGEVLALDAGSGEILWRRRFGAPFRSGPALSGNRLVAVARDSIAFALDTADGRVIWRQRGVQGATAWLGGASPLIAGNVAVLPFASGELIAADLGSGRAGWSAAMTGGRRGLARSAITDLTGGPVLVGPLVVAANQSGRMAAFDGRTGRRVWSRQMGATAPPWPAGETLFAISDTGRLARLDAGTGRSLWEVQLPVFEDPEDREDPIGYSGPVLVGGRVLFSDSLGNLHAYDGVTAEGGVAVEMPGGSITGPVVAAGTVYLLTDEGDLLAYR